MTAILRIADLRAAAGRILDASERQFGPEIELESLPVGYRWELELPAIFNDIEAPCAQMLGDPNDDLDSILELLQRPEDETTIWHDLSHLIGVLQLLALMDHPGWDDFHRHRP